MYKLPVPTNFDSWISVVYIPACHADKESLSARETVQETNNGTFIQYNYFMKKLLSLVLLAALASSCSMFKASTASTMEVDQALISVTSAELQVSDEKISYTYYPKKADRKSGFKHILNNATSAALKENGNADVLVERQHEVIAKKRLLRPDKIKSITVTGYPATYKNFKVESVK